MCRTVLGLTPISAISERHGLPRRRVVLCPRNPESPLHLRPHLTVPSSTTTEPPHSYCRSNLHISSPPSTCHSQPSPPPPHIHHSSSTHPHYIYTPPSHRPRSPHPPRYLPRPAHPSRTRTPLPPPPRRSRAPPPQPTRATVAGTPRRVLSTRLAHKTGRSFDSAAPTWLQT